MAPLHGREEEDEDDSGRLGDESLQRDTQYMANFMVHQVTEDIP